MKILVCIKAVRQKYVFDDKIGQNDYTFNPYDLLALQKVLEKRNKEKVQVICLSMGEREIKDVLVKAIALGADDVYWLCDRVFAGADTIATSYALAECTKKIGKCELIVCGGKAVDGETGQVGISIGERLGIPCITNVDEIISIDEKFVVIRCMDNRECLTVKAELPAVIIMRQFTTVCSTIRLQDLKRAQHKELNIWTADDIELDVQRCGMKGSKTQVIGVTSELNKKSGSLLEGKTKDKVKFLDELLTKGSVVLNG